MKNQKPTEYDVSFKYVCDQCEASHWLFLREVQVDGFKVVCECGNIFLTETIDKLNIVYKYKENLNVDFFDQSVRMMVALGYSKNEAKEMIDKSLAQQSFDSSNDLVKYSLKNFGASYV